MSTSPDLRSRGTAARTGRAIGFLVAAGVNGVLLYLVNESPGWEAVPFFTAATEEVLPWVNASLALGVVVNVVYALWQAPRMRNLGETLTAVVAVAAAQRLWVVFPFDLGAPWSWIVRWVLVVVIVGSVISVVVQFVQLVRGPREG